MLFMSFSLKYPGAVCTKHWDFVSSKRGRAQRVWESNCIATYVLGSFLGQKNILIFFARGTIAWFIRKRRSCL